jgi:hypothetical protein
MVRPRLCTVRARELETDPFRYLSGVIRSPFLLVGLSDFHCLGEGFRFPVVGVLPLNRELNCENVFYTSVAEFRNQGKCNEDLPRLV